MKQWRRLASGEEGIAIIVVMLMVLIMSALGTVMLSNVQGELSGVGRQRKVTTARAAADGGIDRLVFALQQGTNWDGYVTSYNSTTGAWWGDAAQGGWWPVGKGRFRAHVDCDGLDCTNGDTLQRLLTVEGQFPSGSGPVRTLQATIRKQAPAALSFAMFGDRDVTVHHHGSSWISPTIVTTQIHSNGSVKLDYSSTYHVDLIEAVGALEIGAGRGKHARRVHPGDGIQLGVHDPRRRHIQFPALLPLQGVSAQGRRQRGLQLLHLLERAQRGELRLQPQMVRQRPGHRGRLRARRHGEQPGEHGDLFFGRGVQRHLPVGHQRSDHRSVHPRPHGRHPCGPDQAERHDLQRRPVRESDQDPLPVRNHAPCSGVNCLADCPKCSQGTSDQGGYAGGSVISHPAGWAPAVVDFPSLDYATVYKPRAQTDQGGATCVSTAKKCHIFPTSDGKDFLTYIANKNIIEDKDYDTSTCQTCLFWTDANKNKTTDPHKVAYVIARGTHYLNSGSLSLDWSAIRTTFGTDSGKPTPTIMIQGSMIVAAGDVDAQSSLTVVGQTMDPFNPLGAYGASTVPGLLAAARGMHASDYDSDSNWTSTGQYEALKRNATIVRGLVYSASWNAATKKSVPADQHWHNYDPKNATTIIGAQVGGKLHDCNSFLFSYDPLVRNLAGFTSGGSSSGGAYVVDWQEV